MTTGGPETSGGGRPRRGVDLLFWLLAIALLVGMAAAIAWTLSNTSFKLREVTYEDDAVDAELLIPVATEPPPAESGADAASPGDPAPDLAPLEERPANRGAAPRGVAPTRWARQPAPLYPALAASRGVDRGDVTLRCEALASGELGACEIMSESPPGVGFGEAALASMREARVQPRSIDGFRTDSRIAFAVRFRMAPEVQP